VRLRVALKVLRSLPPVRTWHTRTYAVSVPVSAATAVGLPSYRTAASRACRFIERGTARVLQRSGLRAGAIRRRG
jgi:hypothetical protein